MEAIRIFLDGFPLDIAVTIGDAREDETILRIYLGNPGISVPQGSLIKRLLFCRAPQFGVIVCVCV